MSVRSASTSMPKLTLYRGFPDRNRHVWSPFVNKLEFHLRVGGIPYTYKCGSPRNSPSGKIPYVDITPLLSPEYTTKEMLPHEATPQQTLIADSTQILGRLISLGHLSDLNACLTGAEVAHDLSLRALFEDKLYFLGMKEKWIDNYHVHRDRILADKPFVVRYLLGLVIARKIHQTMYLQGCGRYSDEEAAGLVREAWVGVEGLLEERRKGGKGGIQQPFWLLGGREPTDADATVFGFVASVVVCDSCPRTQKLVRSLDAVMDYAGRIHDRYFPDYDKWEA